MLCWMARRQDAKFSSAVASESSLSAKSVRRRENNSITDRVEYRNEVEVGYYSVVHVNLPPAMDEEVLRRLMLDVRV